MCGIAGYWYPSKSVPNTEKALSMLRAQRHRGPDDAGLRSFSLRSQTSALHPTDEVVEIQGGAEGLLGFNRLSILDVSVNGHQPMCSSDQQVMLAFNGEIYNAMDFKGELMASGFQFKGHSDTEVILCLYLKYGFDEMVRKLNGMFAIVLIDLRAQSLYMARDRFGIKPLYVFEAPGLVAFSSEIKSFLALDEFKPALRSELVDEYLLFRNTIHRTMFASVDNLEPGTYRAYSPGGASRVCAYFDMDAYRRPLERKDIGTSIRLLRRELKASVRRQLVSDVKVGCQLSGGIDSSLVTLYAQEQQGSDLETVSVTFDDRSFSEESFMDTVTNSLKIRSHRFKLDAAYYAGAFEKATWHFESPLNHPNTIGIFLLSQRAREYVTVLLSGEGADEVFGGYGRFAQLYKPWNPRTMVSSFLKNGNSSRHLLWYFGEDYRAVMASSFMHPGLARTLKSDFDLDWALKTRRSLYNEGSGDALDKQVKYELKTYLPDLLMRQDKMSMAHSIENRVPFLDNDIVAASFEIPASHLLGSGELWQTKRALKMMAEEQWGESFAYRSKGGFSIPVRGFFQDRQFMEYLQDILLPGIARRKLFNEEPVKRWVKNIQHISSSELDALWIMVAFEAWAQQYRIS